jgi:hypothetical protein
MKFVRPGLSFFFLFILINPGSSFSVPALKALPGHRTAEMAKVPPLADLAETNLSLAIALPLPDSDGLQKFLAERNDPASTNYNRSLSVDEFVARFSPTEDQYQKAIKFAEKNGLKVTSTYKNRQMFNVLGTVADVEKVLHVKMKQYQHPTENRHFFAPDSEPSVDADFNILEVRGLENFYLPHPSNLHLTPLATNSVTSLARQGSAPGGELTSVDLRNAFAPGVTLRGEGQSIALLEFLPYWPKNIALYEQLVGFNINITNVSVNKFSTTPDPGTDDSEQTLDITVAAAMAPAARIMVYEGNEMASILNAMASDGVARQVSCSWLQGLGGDPAILYAVNELQAQGQSVFMASGDFGAYRQNRDLANPLGFPNLTLCGGTVLTMTQPAGGGYQSEVAWSDSGGGWSTNFSLPTYQQGMNMTAIHGSTTFRNFPDVCGPADHFAVYMSETNTYVDLSGTSGTAPFWAGYMALVNEQIEHNAAAKIVDLNTALYNIAKSANYSSAFHDVTTGNNTNSISPTDYFAATGYDLVTGWGSPNGTNLINLLAASTNRLKISPGFGFSTNKIYGGTAPAASTAFVLTNTSSSSMSWTASGFSSWLNMASTSGTIAAHGSTTVTVSLTGAADTLALGTYTSTVTFTDLTTGVAQKRLFVFTVSSAAQPLALNGYNAKVIVPNTGTKTTPGATAVDTVSGFTYYQAGLPGSTGGLPISGRFTSGWDGQTSFQLQPYTGNNALMLGNSYSTSGTLTLSTPQSLNEIVILAVSTYGTMTSSGQVTVKFTDNSTRVFSYNAPDWYYEAANTAIGGLGRVNLNDFSIQDSASEPRLYQTTIPLVLDSTKTVSSLTFTAATTASNTAIFAVSGVAGGLSGLAPSITQQPQLMANADISIAKTITIGVAGAPPLSFQWYSNSVPLPLAVQQTLRLDPKDAATYFVVVSNQYGSVQSAPANVAAPSAGYPATSLQLRPESYWRLNETNGFLAYDYVAGNNGFYTNTVLGQPGYGSASGTGTEPTERAAQFGPTNGAQSRVIVPQIDVSVANGNNGLFSICAWVLASNNVVNGAGIVTKGAGSGDEEFCLDCGGAGNGFRFFVRNAASGTASVAPTSILPDNRWHFLVGVCDQAHSNVTLYVDGTNASQASIAANTGIHSTLIPMTIGARMSGPATSFDAQLLGLVDDVALFTNALSATQAATLYNAAIYSPVIQQQPVLAPRILGGNTLSTAVVATGSNLGYQWFGPTGAIIGATNSSLVLANVQATQSGWYYVQVSNAYATVESVHLPVLILGDSTASYPKAVLALNPFAYWRLNETNGTTAYDYAGFNDGTYENVILGQPGYGSGLTITNTDPVEFSAGFSNAIGSQVDLPQMAFDAPTPGVGYNNAEFSIAAWVKADPSVTNGAPIFCKADGLYSSDDVSLDCGGTNKAFRFAIIGPRGLSAANSSVVPDNKWHWLVGVCDQYAGRVILYIDGAETGEAYILPDDGPLSQGFTACVLGQDVNHVRIRYSGQLNDVAIFTNALTLGQITNLYGQALGKPTITKQPVPSGQLLAGGSFTNQVVATGTISGYQWYGPNGAIFGATNSTLILNNLSVSASGNYYVVVSNFVGTVQSTSTALLVLPTGRYFTSFAPYPGGAFFSGDGSQLFSTAFGTTGAIVQNSGAPTELQLTAVNATNVTSAFELPDLNPGVPVYGFSAMWNSQMYGDYGTGQAGLGFSFNFGQLNGLNLTNGSVESGYSTGLCFSVTNKGTNGTFSLRVNGSTVASTQFVTGQQWGAFNGGRHYFKVDWNFTNGLSVSQDNVAVFTNVPTTGFVSHAGDRFVWAARTSATATAEVRLCNVGVLTGGSLAPIQLVAPYYSDPSTIIFQPTDQYLGDDLWRSAGSPAYFGESVSPSQSLAAYALTAPRVSNERPSVWAFQGSNDGTNWFNVGDMGDFGQPYSPSVTSFLNSYEMRAWLTTNSTSAYTAYRMLVSSSYNSADKGLATGLIFYHLNTVTGPSISTLDASQIAATSAQLNGLAVTAPGPTTAWFQWGTTASYGNTTAQQNIGSGGGSIPFGTVISGLASGDIYHYQAVISNAYGIFFGNDVTLSTTGNPIVFDAFNWSSNQVGAYTTPTISNNVLRLTDGGGSEGRSVFFQVPQYVGAFQAKFTYQDVSGGADGVAFVLQNDPRGIAAMGGIGGSLCYGIANPITPSAALEFNLYTGNNQLVGYTFLTNGVTGANGANGNYHAMGSISLTSGHPINVTAVYAYGQLALAFTDAVTSATFSTNLNVGDLTSVVGGPTAYVGFTGSDGGVTSTQIITNFSFVSIPTLHITVTGGNLAFTWPASIAGYSLQMSTDLSPGSWVTLGNQPTVVNGQNQITLPVSNLKTFYRLSLP